ncbi:MAG TPA: hypothetical protein VJB87_00150 [Candidatus Nanoarchaeia archaeon]|nr:hypothetical protein [Candidatus Nanoarchaeia archaeon]
MQQYVGVTGLVTPGEVAFVRDMFVGAGFSGRESSYQGMIGFPFSRVPQKSRFRCPATTLDSLPVLLQQVGDSLVASICYRSDTAVGIDDDVNDSLQQLRKKGSRVDNVTMNMVFPPVMALNAIKRANPRVSLGLSVGSVMFHSMTDTEVIDNLEGYECLDEVVISHGSNNFRQWQRNMVHDVGLVRRALPSVAITVYVYVHNKKLQMIFNDLSSLGIVNPSVQCSRRVLEDNRSQDCDFRHDKARDFIYMASDVVAI